MFGIVSVMVKLGTSVQAFGLKMQFAVGVARLVICSESAGTGQLPSVGNQGHQEKNLFT